MKVRIIKEPEIKELRDNSLCYAVVEDPEKIRFNSGYLIADKYNNLVLRRKEYKIHTIRWKKWFADKDIEETEQYNYVFQDEILERMIEQYNSDWEYMNNRIFELERDKKIIAEHWRNMHIFVYISHKIEKRWKRAIKVVKPILNKLTRGKK